MSLSFPISEENMETSRFLQLFFVLLVSSTFYVHGASQEGLILQQLARGFEDPDGAFADWNDNDGTPCNWTGVKCSESTKLVVSIDLSNANIVGAFPSVVCRLSALTNLTLSYNYVNGTVPADIRRCRSLQHLDLSQNVLVGGLPEAVAELSSLKYLDLSGNNLTGPIPESYGRMSELRILNLYLNLIESSVPSFLGNLTNLEEFNLAYNPLFGALPPEIGNLTNLSNLWLAGCGLSGQIPESIGNLKKLGNLDLSSNELSGRIPDSVTELESIVQIELYKNSLSGPLPKDLGKLKNLKRFDASMNKLSDNIPESLGNLDLESLNLYQNNLSGSLPIGIGLGYSLSELKIFSNNLSGTLPWNLGEHSLLQVFDIANNNFSGNLPGSLCDAKMLKILSVFNNEFNGSLDVRYGYCKSLTRVRIGGNRFSGNVPDGLWGLPHVSLLELKNNMFSGPITDDIGDARNMTELVIDGNLFSGALPEVIGKLDNLSVITAGNNQFSGEIPAALGFLPQLVKLDISMNNLTGEIISDLSSWKQLAELNLSHNQLSGVIPSSLGDLPVLNYLDLSSNRLSGIIPAEIGKLKLNIFNVSDNDFSGEVPQSFAIQPYETSFLDNPHLCSSKDFGKLRPCKIEKHRDSYWVVRCIFGLAGVILILGLGFFYKKFRTYQESEEKSEGAKYSWTLTSFHRLGFNEYEILDSLDEDNVIGTGGAGKVYKATLSNGETVAIKRLWTSSAKDDNSSGSDYGFNAEVDTLGKIRHKNIVKLLCCCTHNNSNLLVYDYMPNGSLGDLLHGSKSGVLDWPVRYKIAVGAAQGLAYLHHDCVPSIVHRDVKSNNILLDADYGARVADFGLAKIVQSRGVDSMSAIAGSYGYIAPEYAYTLKVNEKSDTYSFGVVLLELVTGRRPVDPEFGENKDLVKWVCNKLEKKDGLKEVLDSKLVGSCQHEMAMVLKVAIVCTSALPINRPSMRTVVELLLEANPQHKLEASGEEAKLSPYYDVEAQDNLV